MPVRTPEQVYALLIQQGFTPAAATTMTAISGPESSYDDQAKGDIGLQTNQWGPSVGLFQIRTLKADTGKGTVRDINWLLASDANQAKAAYSISGGGKDFHPWSTYNSGAYKGYLAKAAAAAAVVTASGPAKFLAGLIGDAGAAVASIPGTAAVGDAVSTVVAPLVDGLRRVSYTGAFAVGGVALVLGGAYLAARPYLKEQKQRVVKVATDVAKVAV